MSIAAALRKSVERFPDKPAIIFGDESWTYAQFDQLTDDLARHLVAAGVRPGDRIALHLPNIPELALSYLGCLKAGAVATPINARLKEREIDYILRHSEAVGYIGHRSHYAEVKGSRKGLPGLRWFCLAGEGASEPGLINLMDLMRPGGNKPPLPDVDVVLPSVILYTSGTTARPKGVTHSQESLLQIAHIMRRLELDENQTALVTSSMTHMAGFSMIFLAGLINGATVALPTGPDADAALQAIERHRCTYTFALPTFLHALAVAQTAARRDMSSLRFVLSGGDSVSSAVQKEFEIATCVGVYEGYGSTECLPMTFNWTGQKRVGSVGRAAGQTRVCIFDAAGSEVAPGEAGEICIQSPALMMGYWKDEEATAKAVRGGWFHTGDLARCDADGYYWFAGRSKQLIIRGGSKISPQEVELLEHPVVREAAVIGRPDALWGEIVVAYVTLQEKPCLTEKELISFAQTRIASYKAPKHIVFRDALPRTATGKLDRRALREAEAASIANAGI